MRFDFFRTRADAHILKAREYLQEANMARLEHQTAADHHAALAAMYSQRAIWLEQELSNANGVVAKSIDGPTHSSPSVIRWFRA
jgi:hypothetical protein